MPDLTARAEEALLGALLTYPWQLDEISVLAAGDFADPVRQASWQAITRAHEQDPAAAGPELARLAARSAAHAQVTEEYLARLSAAVPTPTGAAAYGRMVLEAAFDRQMAGEAARLAAEAGSARGSDAARDQTAVLSSALAGHARNLQAARDGGTGEPGPQPAGPQAALEDRFLGALMQQPTLADWITLDASVFTAPGRREIYEAITSIDGYGEPVDELTVTWALAREAATGDTWAGRTTTAASLAEAIPPGIIARLAAAPLDTQAGLECARDLLASRLHAELASLPAGPAGVRVARDRPGAARARSAAADAAAVLRPPERSAELGQQQLRQEGR